MLKTNRNSAPMQNNSDHCLKMFSKTNRSYRHYNSPFFNEIEFEKLLMGGEGGYVSSCYARLTGDLLRPSRSILDSPHAQLLAMYRAEGENIFSLKKFKTTSYYRNAATCIKLTGKYFGARSPKEAVKLAREFCQMLDGKQLEKHLGAKNAKDFPIIVRRILFSDCFEILRGEHLLALASAKGFKKCLCMVEPFDPAITPIQQMVLDSNGRQLYHPISAPELASWPLIRRCNDRMKMMADFLARKKIVSGSHLDVGCCYGWFVAEMSKLGFQALGVDRNPASLAVGQIAYGLPDSTIEAQDVVAFLNAQSRRFDVVTCLSILHHFVLVQRSISAVELIQKIDAITNKVLFFDTGECHEDNLTQRLATWDAKFIEQWLKEQTSFDHIEVLGIDSDNVGHCRNRYQRHLFACSRS